MSETATKQNFVHLHVHTHISVQDALPSPTELAMYARKTGFPAVAITDHGKMAGAVEFVDACRKPADGLPAIKPIIGYEAYVTEDMDLKQHIMCDDGAKRKPPTFHLTLLAMNEVGYKNLMHISTVASTVGKYYTPRISHSWLADKTEGILGPGIFTQNTEGIIALSGCLGGEIAKALSQDNIEKAEAAAQRYVDIFGDRFYIELQYHKEPEQKRILPMLRDIANKFNIKMVCTNDAHYLQPEDWEVHDVLIAIRDMKDDDGEGELNVGKRNAYKTRQYWLKSEEEMTQVFGKFSPESISNTLEISDRIEDYFKLDVPQVLPEAAIPDDDDLFNRWRAAKLPYHQKNEAYLAYLSRKGLKELGYDKSPTYLHRLKYELKQIWHMGVVDYFLIQAEMVQFMKTNGILFGIRGSAPGSLVNYCLGVSSADPIRWNLSFERFLNPGRGTQYTVNYSIYPSKKYKEEFGEEAQEEAVARLQNIINEKQTEEEFKQFIPVIEKELWVLENQELATYICWLADNNHKSEKNESQSWLAYFLGITNERPTGDLIVSKVATLPDVDTDIDDSRREEVIDWAKQRFGEERVAHIGNRGTFKAKNAVVYCLKISDRFRKQWGTLVPQKTQEISKTIPDKMTIEEALENSPEFVAWYNKYPEEIENAKKIVGKISNMGVHAAGILISRNPIWHSTPIECSGKFVASGYDMTAVERVGLVKYDYLGLANYQMVSRALDLIEKRKGLKIDLYNVDLEDKKVYTLYTQDKCSTLFQVSSDLFKKWLGQMHVDCPEDLIAIIALCRPGPMDNIPMYVEGKRNPDKIKYNHPVVEKYLKSTYGMVLYQEQAMFLGQEMGKLTWNEIDKLRKAISKKNPEDFKYITDILKKKALKNGYSKEVIDEISALMEKFAGYAFNRSHSCSYAILSFWTAYLRYYYPSEWFAAVIQVDSEDTGKDAERKLAIHKRECIKEGIKVLNPNVNDSGFETTVTSQGNIALPLISIKGVGANAKVVVANQPFESLADMANKAKPNRGMVAAFAENHALDCFEEVRHRTAEEIMTLYDECVDLRKKKEKQADKEAKMKYKVVSPFTKNKKELNGNDNITKQDDKKKTIPMFKLGISGFDE